MKLPLVLVLAAVASALGCGTSTSSPDVSAIALSPSPCAVGRTDSVQLAAIATLPDGTKEDVTTSSSWSTGNAQTATVNGTGVVVGVNGGVTKITSSYGGATGTVDCTVAP